MKVPSDYPYNPIYYLLFVKLPVGLLVGFILWLIWKYFHDFFPWMVGVLLANLSANLNNEFKKKQDVS